jgi:ferritin-like metal-binding protein YciE
MALDSLEKLFEEELRDVYSAEKQLLKALPKMAKAASIPKLSAGFTKHLAQTEEQVTRLEKVFELLGKPAKAKKCMAMEGLIEEASELLEEEAEPMVLDAALIAAAQKVEHYEIATYGTLVTWAGQLGLTQVARLLSQTLKEEKDTDAKLTQLAESEVNAAAEFPDEE